MTSASIKGWFGQADYDTVFPWEFIDNGAKKNTYGTGIRNLSRMILRIRRAA